MPIYLQHGNLIDYVPPTDTSTEDVVFMGGLVGIPQTFIPAGELGALSVDGVYMFTKKDGVSVNLGDVVKYCGTTKLAQDSNADLTLGVAVAKAEADSLGVKVKINSVLPTESGGGGGSGEVTLCGASGLYFDGGNVAIKYCGNSAINADTNGVYLAVCGDSGLSIQDGQLVASGGGGGDIEINPYGGLEFGCGGLSVKIGSGLSFGSCGELNATGGGGGGGSIGLTDKNSFIITGCASPNDQGELVNIGYCNFSSSYGSVILGAFTNNCSATDAVVIGRCSGVLNNATGGIAIGVQAQVASDGCGSIAIGLEAKSKSTVAGCGNIVIGSGINPYTDSALLVVGGNGDYGDFRRGVLFYAPTSDFTEVSGSSSNGGIAFVTSENSGDSWTISCNLSF